MALSGLGDNKSVRFTQISRKIMNLTQVKCLIVFLIFAVIGIGPISPTCLIGMYIVIKRPRWFFDLVGNLYEHKPQLQERLSADTENQTRQARIKCFLSLLGLFILDIAPIPVAAFVAFPVILGRPLWFVRTCASVYGQDLKM